MISCWLPHGGQGGKWCNGMVRERKGEEFLSKAKGFTGLVKILRVTCHYRCKISVERSLCKLCVDACEAVANDLKPIGDSFSVSVEGSRSNSAKDLAARTAE